MTICSICCSRITAIDVVRRNVKKLVCGHRFHEKCISKSLTNYKRTCPNCTAYVFNELEERLLRCVTHEQMADLLLKPHDSSIDVVEIYKNRYRSAATDTMMTFLLKNFDMTTLFVYALKLADKELVRKILQTTRLNWHKTINGVPLVEEALKLGYDTIKAVLNQNKHIVCPFNFYEDKQPVIESSSYKFLYPNIRRVDDTRMFDMPPMASAAIPSAPEVYQLNVR